MNLLVVRHGQTNYNLNHIILSKTDDPLNETGISQAQTTAKNLEREKIDLIISSPLRRTKQTAEIINKGRNIPIIYDKRLVERDFGEFEGLKDSDAKFNIKDFWDYEKNINYYEAENVQAFYNRIFSFLDNVLEKYSNKNVLLVCHAAVSAVINCYFTEIPKKNVQLFFKMGLDNCEYRTYNMEKFL